jgi:hypothetical protein
MQARVLDMRAYRRQALLEDVHYCGGTVLCRNFIQVPHHCPLDEPMNRQRPMTHALTETRIYKFCDHLFCTLDALVVTTLCLKCANIRCGYALGVKEGASEQHRFLTPVAVAVTERLQASFDDLT